MTMPKNQLVTLFKTLADSTRLEILSLLKNEDLKCDCSSSLLHHLNITQPTLSHHIKQLLQAGIITETRKGNFHRYQIAKNWKILISNFLQNN